MGLSSLRVALVATLPLLAFAAPASAVTELNVIPHGQSQPGSAFLSAPGALPADTQAKMYDRLTPLYRSVTQSALTPSVNGNGFFKSARLVTNPADPTLLTDQTVTGTGAGGTPVSARIRRDEHGVPHIYSASNDGVIFGAGYVTGEDRSLLINQARTNGLASLIDLPGVPGIGLVLGLYDYQPSAKVIAETTKQQDDALKAAGAEGAAVLRDIDTYIAGLNTWRAAKSPTTKPYTRTDIYAVNGIKAQFLGEGGGNELGNEKMLGGLRAALGKKTGSDAYEDLRQRLDPEHPRTGLKRASHYEDVSLTEGKGVVHLRQNSFKSSDIRLPDEGASARAAVAEVEPAGDQKASNILLLNGKRTTTGKPMFVGGPQIGYNYPGLTMEMGLYGPDIKVRGATSAPFPGYMLIGRGENFGFSLTSAGADIKDTYAETLCGSDTKYRYKGTCRTMETIDAGTISKGGKSVKATYRRTVHGPVVGYAKNTAGKRIAVSVRRSSAGRETTDQLLFRRLTFGQIKDAKSLNAAAALTPQTFNSFLSTDKDIAYYMSGRLPQRPAGVNPDLLVDGTGKYEWKGFLASSKHPQDANPSSGTIINWNNEAAPGWPASDERVSQGPVDRVKLLQTEIARKDKHDLASILASANAAATQDPRGKLAWPSVRAILRKAKAPSALATKVVSEIDKWSKGGATWVDANVDGTIDAAGVPALQAVWKDVVRAAMCDRLGTKGCAALEDRMDEESIPPGGLSSGWMHYVDKDLRRLAGKSVKGAYNLEYCGRGFAARCATKLWAALDKAAKREASKKGNDPSKWRRATSTAEIEFSPVPLIKMQFTNRPSGIHQVLQFAP